MDSLVEPGIIKPFHVRPTVKIRQEHSILCSILLLHHFIGCHNKISTQHHAFSLVQMRGPEPYCLYCYLPSMAKCYEGVGLGRHWLNNMILLF